VHIEGGNLICYNIDWHGVLLFLFVGVIVTAFYKGL